jgi:isoleucyl-tRNA synthetase
MFQAVESSVSFPKLEEAVARFWKERGIYEKSLAARRDAAPFVFYEGPPTANGLPHPGHCLTRAIKDLFPRYKTMRGLRCQRKAGWDTHGLPVEVEVCKELGIHSKEEIEAFGVEPFIQKCLESVFRYTKQWEHLTERLGFWIHLDDAYVTYHQSYVESVWWALKTLFDRGLLYQGYKIVWWWAQGGTALSSGEVGQGYREVADPAVFVRFPLVAEGGEGRGAGNGGKPLAASQKKSPLLVGEGQGEGQQQSPLLVGEGQGSGRIVVEEWDEPPLLVGEGQGEGQQQSPLPVGEGQGEGLLRNADLLVWTTTPWTLPSNQFAAVKPDLDYAVVSVEGEPRKLILAAALVENVMTKVGKEFSVLATIPGEKLIGLRYVPPFDCYYKDIDSDRNCTMLDTTGMDESEKAEYRRKRLEWRVVVADFVTTDTGTGIVHIAPAFGEDDFRLLQQLQQQIDVGYMPVLLNPVTANGMFTAEVPQYKGRWVKDCDRDIIRDLKARGLLFHQEQYKHDYPFCWRAEEDPLIQYPRKSWFIRTTALKDKMLANNRLINWLPEHIRDGRFGNFLETNVDWALSRERY